MSLTLNNLQYWCWLGKGYFGFRPAGEYIWLWLALLVSLLTCIPLALFFWGHRSYPVTMIVYVLIHLAPMYLVP